MRTELFAHDKLRYRKMTTSRKCPTHHESQTVTPSPPSRCRAVNPPQSQKSSPLSLLRRHLFGFLEPRSPITLKIKKTVSGLTSCFKFMTLSWDWSCARQHICERPPSFRLTPPHFCVSISPPDVGGMRQNSAAPLLFSSTSRSMLECRPEDHTGPVRPAGRSGRGCGRKHQRRLCYIVCCSATR